MMKLTDAFCNFVNAPKTAITLQNFKNATMYYYYYYYYYYWLKDLSSDQNATVWSVGIFPSQANSLCWKQPPLPTVMKMGCAIQWI